MTSVLPRRLQWRGFWLLLILVLAALLRIWSFPPFDDNNDVDEPSYLQGGLELIEGTSPPYHYAPAGPQSWLGWVHAGVASSRYLVFPTAEEREVPIQVRPYVAVNHALFDLYRDMRGMRREYVAIAMLMSLFAVAAGFGLGKEWGGIGGAVLLGGLTAFLPLLIEQAGLAKPYSMAWSFLIIAFYFSARSRPRASAIFLGLSIGSRIEMLALLPLACLVLWPLSASLADYARRVLRYLATVVITMLLIAPWLVTNLLGNLRAIFTIRFGPPPNGDRSIQDTLKEFAWQQGLGIVGLLLLVSTAIVLIKRRSHGAELKSADQSAAGSAASGSLWQFLVMGYSLLMVATVFRQTGYGMRHQGPAIMGLLVVCPLAVRPLMQWWPRLTMCLIGAAVLLPLYQGTRWTVAFQSDTYFDGATPWIEAHIPAGTTVYTNGNFHVPLSTPECADLIWDDVMRREAARRKFSVALDRFSLQKTEMPRALSEQTMLTERSTARRWYLLGSRSSLAGPRYNIRRYANSGVFGEQHPLENFKKTGGVLAWRADGPAKDLGAPYMKWTARNGRGTYLYISRDVEERLISR